jgi:fructokinase
VRALGPALVVVTLGERGCWFDGPSGQGLVPAAAVPVVDTTGAGDGFVAGLLDALAPSFAAGLRPAQLSRQTVEAACRHGNRVAGCVVTRLGATAALPRADELPLLTWPAA